MSPRPSMPRVLVLGRELSLIVASIASMGLLTACGDDTITDDDNAGTLPVVTTIVITGIPEAIPAGAVPEGAATSGVVASNGATGSSAVEFEVTGEVDREILSNEAREAIETAGWEFVERVYDDTSMSLTFESSDGSAALTWVLVTRDDSAVGSVTVVEG